MFSEVQKCPRDAKEYIGGIFNIKRNVFEYDVGTAFK